MPSTASYSISLNTTSGHLDVSYYIKPKSYELGAPTAY